MSLPERERGTQGTVLLVDDDPNLRETGAQVLRALGYRVLAARDGPEALRLYRQEGPVDLVLLDYYLPDHTGGEVAAALKSLDPRVKVLLLSGGVGLPAAGTLGVIQKPFRMAELARRITAALQPSDPGG